MVNGLPLQDIGRNLELRRRSVQPLMVGSNIRVSPSPLSIRDRSIGICGTHSRFTTAVLRPGCQQLVREGEQCHAARGRVALLRLAATCMDTSGSSRPSSSKLDASILSRPFRIASTAAASISRNIRPMTPWVSSITRLRTSTPSVPA